jgi:7-cyano-7-deazaguanine synthase in queuosine biosynthesis
MSSISNTGHSKSYDFDFSKPFAVQWGETRISEDPRLDAYEIQDQRIADWLNQKLPPLYADAIDIAAAAHCADRLSLRGTKKRGWGRDLRLKIPVRCLAVWQSAAVRDALFEALQFLTQDKWQIDFDQKGEDFRQSETQEHLFEPSEVQAVEVCLYSGGLDSFAGLAARIFDEPKNHYLCLSVTPNHRQRQRQREQLAFLHKELRAKITHIPVRYCLRDAEQRPQETTRRTRGFLFGIIGGVAALMAGSNTLHLYENGVGAINLPLDGSQIGIDNSRSVHPMTLQLLSRLLSLLGRQPFVIHNECLYLTKAEMCRHPAVKRVSSEIAHTFSCDGFPVRRRKFAQCGFCSSCLLRRQALEAAALADFDGNDYGCDLCLEGPFQPHHLRALRAMHYQSTRLLKALIAPDAWTVLCIEFPELRRVAETMAADATATDVRDRLIRLYERHVREWSAFSPLKHLQQQSPNSVSTCVV